MEEEYVTRCVVDTLQRKFYLYSSEGEKRVVDCDNVEQFMSVLNLVRDTCPEGVLSYADPLWGKINF